MDTFMYSLKIYVGKDTLGNTPTNTKVVIDMMEDCDVPIKLTVVML
jgi:hypothetical protein